MILFADSDDPDQIARMSRLIRISAVRICPNTRFRIMRPIYTPAIRLLWYFFAGRPFVRLSVFQPVRLTLQETITEIALPPERCQCP